MTHAPRTETARGPATMPNPALIIDLAVAYRRSMILFAASNLDIFSALADGPVKAADVAARCRTVLRPTLGLLNACVAEGLLTRTGDRYANTPEADAFLVRGRPAYIGDGLKYAEDLYPAWGRLVALAKTNEPPVKAEEMLGGDEARTRNFVLGMHNRARGIAAALPYGISLQGRRQLLDVGGGPGTYSMALVSGTPGLRSTVLDLPGVLAITRELIAEQGLSDRISLRPGSYLTDEFPAGNDVVLLSGMMHRETPETCQLLLRKAHAALEADGLVIVSDVFFEDEGHDSPPFAAHFALNMMLTSPDGSAHAKTEMREWMRAAGFGQIEIKELPPPNPHTLLYGIRT